jgi:hypothetical protein
MKHRGRIRAIERAVGVGTCPGGVCRGVDVIDLIHHRPPAELHGDAVERWEGAEVERLARRCDVCGLRARKRVVMRLRLTEREKQ